MLYRFNLPFTCDDIEINFSQRRITVAGREVRLTPTEYNLLQELVLNANKVLTHVAFGGEKEVCQK